MRRRIRPEEIRDLFQAVPPPPGLDRWRRADPGADPRGAGREVRRRPRRPARPRTVVPVLCALAAAAVVAVIFLAVRPGGSGPAPAVPVPGTSSTTAAPRPSRTVAGSTPATVGPTAMGEATSDSSRAATPPASAAGSTQGITGATASPAPSPRSGTGLPAGVTLRPWDGDLVISTAGTVIDARLVRGSIIVQAPNVTIRRTRVAPPSSAPWAIQQASGARNLRVEDCELAGADHTHVGINQEAAGLTVQRCDVHDVDTGVSFDSGATVSDSRFHDVDIGVGSDGGASGVTIQRNVITTRASSGESAIDIFTRSGPQLDVVVTGNMISGGNYTLHVGEGTGEQRITFRGNRFGRGVHAKGGVYGPVAGWVAGTPGNVWAENVWADTGAPVTP